MTTNPTYERFDVKVDRQPNGCWIWSASTDSHGYGKFKVGGRLVGAHRFSYERHVGPIPAGLYLDHLCRNRACVNPAHLEPVSNRENILRGVGFAAVNAAKTHCPNGHPLSGNNLYVRPSTGGRGCRTCIAAQGAARYGLQEGPA